MKRVQILLKQETHKKVVETAKKKNVSVSSFIRKAVEKEVQKKSKEQNTVLILRDAANNAFPGGPEDLSTNNDYLYQN